MLCLLNFPASITSAEPPEEICHAVQLSAKACIVCMQIAKHSQTRFRIKFLNYDQSSKCYGMRDSSVSYAAAVVTAEGAQ